MGRAEPRVAPDGQGADSELLEHVPCTMALLDAQGLIVAVNPAWRRFALANGADERLAHGLGIDYLAACRGGDAAGLSAHDGIRDVLQGRSPSFELGYACHTSTSLRWFHLRARPTATGACVLHEDVTDTRVAQARLRVHAYVSRANGARLPMLRACRELASLLCSELEWDFAAIWTLDLTRWRLRCADAFVKAGDQLGGFEQATRQASLGPGAGGPGRAWTSAKVQWANDLDVQLVRAELPQVRKVMPPASLRSGFKTQLAFPLKCGDDVLAVVELFSRVRREPDRALMEQLEVTGDQLALWELTERARECARLAEREAEEARTRLQSVLDCAPARVLAVDRNGQIDFVNRVAPEERLEDVIGSHWGRYVTADEHARVERALAETLRHGTPQSLETSLPVPGGGRRWLQHHLGPMRSGDQITGAVVVMQDCTAAKLAQSELAEAQRLASVGTLAAGVAHEINTPVQFVSDSVHFLRDAVRDIHAAFTRFEAVVQALEAGADQASLARLCESARACEHETDLAYVRERVPGAFERAIDGLERVATIVRSMKEFAHPAGHDMAAVDLNRAVAATLTVARNEYKYVADLETSFGALPPVVCLVNEINQVVLNIVVNAAHAIGEQVKGTDRKGRIRVSTRQCGPWAEIAVADTGPGIPEHARGRIFEPFFTTKEVGKGTGQGLALARTAIRDHHRGELTFETVLGEGTTFYIRIPLEGRSDEEPRP